MSHIVLMIDKKEPYFYYSYCPIKPIGFLMSHIVLMIDKKTHIFIIPIVPYYPLGFWCPNFLDLGLPHLMLPSFPLDGQLATLNSLIMINEISTHFFSQTIVKRGKCFDDVKDEKTVNNCSPGNNLMQLIKRPDYKNTICTFIFHSVFHFWSP